MGCCGDLRAKMAWEAAVDAPPVPPMPHTQAMNGQTATRRPDVTINYVGRNSLTVKGTYTGRAYRFSPASRTQSVDARDGRVLLRTRYFRRA